MKDGAPVNLARLAALLREHIAADEIAAGIVLLHDERERIAFLQREEVDVPLENVDELLHERRSLARAADGVVLGIAVPSSTPVRPWARPLGWSDGSGSGRLRRSTHDLRGGGVGADAPHAPPPRGRSGRRRGSAADRAGIETGDVILQINETAVVSRDAAREALADLPPERAFKLTVRRGDQHLALDVPAADQAVR